MKKRRKQTNFGVEDISADRADSPARQTFFTDSHFAGLHAAVESLGQGLWQSDLVTQSAHAVALASQEVPERFSICHRPTSDTVEPASLMLKVFRVGATSILARRVPQHPVPYLSSEDSGPEAGGYALALLASLLRTEFNEVHEVPPILGFGDIVRIIVRKVCICHWNTCREAWRLWNSSTSTAMVV